MIANYHTHTYRCRHAEGQEEEYVKNAIAGGLKILGFSDHTPYGFPGDYYTHMRMYPNELEGYLQVVQDLKEKYASHITIHLGLEVEYYPAFFPALLARLRRCGIEYILLGQHWSGNEMGEPYNGRPTDSEAQLEKYCDQVIEAMKTGLFTYLAHPDLLHFVGEDAVYARHMTRLCEAAKKTNTPLELNLLGIQSGRHYPKELFWKIAADCGCSVVLGCDAHRPQDVYLPEYEEKALELIKKYGITLLDTVPLRKL